MRSYVTEYPMSVHVTDLAAGDCVLGPDDTPVTILRNAEDGTDLFGGRLLRFWSRREDTGDEGFMSYGPTGFVARALEVEA